ncbi:MAG TPA: hypothetical protein DDZ84_01445 [Firmicutes bacterium]|nr:hypothetical protein [Bacillota bacterium]
MLRRGGLHMSRKRPIAVLIGLCILAAGSTLCTASDEIFNWWIVPAGGLASLPVTRFATSGHTGAWDMSPDGELIAVSTKSGIRILSLPGRSTVSMDFVSGKGTARDIQWHPDGTIIYSCCPSLTDTWFQITWPDGKQSILANEVSDTLFFSPDRKLAIARDSRLGDGKIGLYDVSADATTSLPYECSTALWSPDGSMVAVDSSDGLTLLNRNGEVVAAHSARFIPMDWSNDSKHLLISHRSRALLLLDALTEDILQSVAVDSWAPSASLSPDGKRVAYETFESQGFGSGDSVSELWAAEWGKAPMRIVGSCSGFIGHPIWTTDSVAIVVPVKSVEPSPDLDLPLARSAVQSGRGDSTTPTTDFRNVRWGMTIAEVTTAETEAVLSPVTGHSVLAGSTTVAGRRVNLFYRFTDSRLSETFYVFQDTHINENLYIEDFRSMKELLALKYGPPTIDEMLWEGNLYRDRKDKWGFAVLCGDLMYWAEWDTPRTTVTLVLSGDNFKAFHSLTYQSKVGPAAGPDLWGL